MKHPAPVPNRPLELAYDVTVRAGKQRALACLAAQECRGFVAEAHHRRAVIGLVVVAVALAARRALVLPVMVLPLVGALALAVILALARFVARVMALGLLVRPVLLARARVPVMLARWALVMLARLVPLRGGLRLLRRAGGLRADVRMIAFILARQGAGLFDLHLAVIFRRAFLDARAAWSGVVDRAWAGIVSAAVARRAVVAGPCGPATAATASTTAA